MWKINKLRELFRYPEKVTARIPRLRWLGHIAKLEKGRVTKIVLESEGESNRGRWRPRQKWMEAAKEDLGRLGVGQWRKLAQDRNKMEDNHWSFGPLGMLCWTIVCSCESFWNVVVEFYAFASIRLKVKNRVCAYTITYLPTLKRDRTTIIEVAMLL